MSSATTVLLDEGEPLPIGQLFTHRRRGSESATFTYSGDYLALPGAYAVDPALPLAAYAHHTPANRPLFGAFQDAAPDRWGRTLIARREARIARDAGRSPRSLGEIDFLLGVRDDLRQGALRFADTHGAFLAPEESGVPALTDLPSLLDLADRAERDAAQLSDLDRLVHAGGSLGGARPKAHVRLPSGALAIAKFPSASHDTWDVMAWEHVLLTLAHRAGIAVPRHELLDLAGRRVLLVERFDRDPARPDRRAGYVSAMTMLEASDGDHASYLDLAAIVEERSDRTTADLHELWRRLVFSILTTNVDDHLRNHGFLHVPGRDAWRLSPAFDMNPEPLSGPQTHATSIDGSDAPSTIARALGVAADFRLAPHAAQRTLGQVADAVSGWRTEAARAGLSSASVEQMAPAFDQLP